MSRVLVLGGGGMLGHKLAQTFAERFDTTVTLRDEHAIHAAPGLFAAGRTLTGVTVEDLRSVEGALASVRPDVVVNAIGIVKQQAAAHDPVPSITVNALFPHQVARLCTAAGSRLIHISTDCVFSGRRGMYREEDEPDAQDLYGRTKLLGEVSVPGTLTLRTSIIGRELVSSLGLVEWFLSRGRGPVRGFRNAIFSGLTTADLSRLIASMIEDHPALTGLYHVSSSPIDKHALLQLVRGAYGTETEVVPCDEPHIDRSLDSSAFRSITGYAPPSWPDTVAELAGDPTPYDQWRHSHVL